MDSIRLEAVRLAGTRQVKQGVVEKDKEPMASFAKYVFSKQVMQKMLPPEIYENVLEAMEGRGKIDTQFADAIALAMREWATGLGATHYTHWFQPQTGSTAEKHDCFVAWDTDGRIIEEFSGKQLIQGEPDASSFPSGGLRSTYEARGYTGWDPTSAVFLWEGGDGFTLCIPSIFFSWTGAVLDNKIPLLRSETMLNRAVLRLLHHTGLAANHVYSTLGLEQEYFVVDRALRDLRPDLVLAGKTVQGAAPAKGQELQDHYFGAVKDRILCFMQDFEQRALKLGIPLKTRHNEVAPAQHEVAHVFERTSAAIDHNILLMELMRQTAVKHDLSCLLHEKPFTGVNGSGKHANWSLMTDSGINLLDPSKTPNNNLHFIFLLAAILHAVHAHAPLLRASIGSLGNDSRLGGHEAPPPIISVYLGKELEELLEQYERTGSHASSALQTKYNLQLAQLPELIRENTDRNRTSPFAFTGNKFEFRAVGSACNPSFAVTALNVIVAEQINKMVDQLEVHLSENKNNLLEAALAVIRPTLQASKDIRFSGDNYGEEWRHEAFRRGLKNIGSSAEAFRIFLEQKTRDVFEGILTQVELRGRYEVALATYLHDLNIETNLLLELVKTAILPAAFKYQRDIGTSIQAVQSGSPASAKQQKKWLENLSQGIEQALALVDSIEKERKESSSLLPEEQVNIFISQIKPLVSDLRKCADGMESLIDDQIWPLPKYRELLFMV